VDARHSDIEKLVDVGRRSHGRRKSERRRIVDHLLQFLLHRFRSGIAERTRVCILLLQAWRQLLQQQAVTRA